MTLKNETSKIKRNKIKFGLKNIRACLAFIGNPQNKFKSVLIGGTNGKGSVTFYLSNLASKYTNLNIGRYTSPHLVSWNERFVINESIVNSKLLQKTSNEAINKIKRFEAVNNEVKLTEFEIYTVIAFYLFAKENIDLAFLEVGMGGRLDATNVVKENNVLCSVITNVSFDHTDFLGNSIKEIAYEKAGIIKENNYVVAGAKHEALEVIKNKTNELHSNLTIVNSSNQDDYQEKNIKIALATWGVISKKLNVQKQESNKYLFLKSLQFPGRFQFIENENILLDGAHNPAAAYELRKLLALDFTYKNILYIIGILNKDYRTFIKNLIPKNSTVICTEPKSNRATKKEILAKSIHENGSSVILSNNLQDAIKKAKSMKHDLIVITGSLYLIGEALNLIQHNKLREMVLK